MEFFVKVLRKWCEDYRQPFTLYGADGMPISYWNTEPKKHYFPPKMDEVCKIENNWCCYPVNVNGEYCGCFCWQEELEGIDFYDIIMLCRLLETACEVEE